LLSHAEKNTLTMRPNCPYYFAMLVAAASKRKTIYVGNISVFDGATPCDITKTGYGIVFYQ